MPIANCIVRDECKAHCDQLGHVIERWAEYANESLEHMTLNVIVSDQQYGKPYAVIATLLLPTIWPEHSREALQLGLAKALAEVLQVSGEQVLVVMQLVESGCVVEAGNVQSW